jgi:Fe-S cluster assembly protein SufD
VRAEAGASATIVESFFAVDEATSLTNAVTEIDISTGGRIDYIKIQAENTASYHMHTVLAVQKAESSLNMFSLALGGAIARSDIRVNLDGTNAECTLNGLYMADGTQLTDHHTFIHHTVPHCSSHELFKGILDGKARAVFTGKVYVDAAAQKTDSKQTNRNLMLSDTATIDTQPQLEIFADDVKCTHGATVGGMNEQTVFYLKSRGIGGITARGIVTVGYAAEVTEKIAHAASRSRVDALIVAQLRKKLGNEIPEIVHSGTINEKG